MLSQFPKSWPYSLNFQSETPILYKIGIGDTITFSRLIENNRSNYETENQWPIEQRASNYKLGIGDTVTLALIKKTKSNEQAVPAGDQQNVVITSQQIDETINSTARIGSDGSVLLLEVGRLDADGKSLNELRSEVRNILIRNGISPRFQLEISDFKSKKAYLTINSASKVIVLNDQRTTIRDILTSAEVGFVPGVITRIRLQRGGKEFFILLRDLYKANKNNIDVQSGDHIFIEDSSAKIKETASIVDNEGNVFSKVLEK